MKKMFTNIKFILYCDIAINILIGFILSASLLLQSFSIIPIQLTQKFLGINLLINIFETFHYVLIGITLIFITQSIILLNEFSKNRIQQQSIINLLFYKWLIQTVNGTVPYMFRIDIPTIFIIINMIIFSCMWYLKLYLDQNRT